MYRDAVRLNTKLVDTIPQDFRDGFTHILTTELGYRKQHSVSIPADFEQKFAAVFLAKLKVFGETVGKLGFTQVDDPRNVSGDAKYYALQTRNASYVLLSAEAFKAGGGPCLYRRMQERISDPSLPVILTGDYKARVDSGKVTLTDPTTNRDKLTTSSAKRLYELRGTDQIDPVYLDHLLVAAGMDKAQMPDKIDDKGK